MKVLSYSEYLPFYLEQKSNFMSTDNTKRNCIQNQTVCTYFLHQIKWWLPAYKDGDRRHMLSLWGNWLVSLTVHVVSSQSHLIFSRGLTPTLWSTHGGLRFVVCLAHCTKRHGMSIFSGWTGQESGESGHSWYAHGPNRLSRYISYVLICCIKSYLSHYIIGYISCLHNSCFNLRC